MPLILRRLLSRLTALVALLPLGCGAQPLDDMPADSFLHSVPEAEYDRNILFYAAQAPPSATLADAFRASADAREAFFEALPEDSLHTAYARGKWTIAEVIQHVISYEHIMAESLLMIADRAPRPLRYQRYTQASTAAGAEGKTQAQLLADLRAARAETEAALASLTDAEQRIVGRHEGFRTSPRVLALCILGHQTHHFGIVRDRYLR